MELRPGYKQTGVGVIPEEWEVKCLDEIAGIRSGIAKNANTKVSDPVLVHYLRVANVQDGYLDLSEISRLEVSRSDLHRFSVLPGDVLMNEGGDRDKLGRGSVWAGEFQPCVHQNHVFVVRCGPSVTPAFLTAWSAGWAARKYFLLAGKQTTNLASINKTSLGKLPVVIPRKYEQAAIAEALSDLDALLGGLDRILVKKRDLKQAAMQQLLTGQTRLAGFTTAWVPLNMARNSVLKARIGWQGLTRAEYLQTGSYYLVTGTDFSAGRVKWSTCAFVSADRYEQDQNIQLRANDILLTKDGTTGKVAFVEELPGPATLNSGVFVIRPRGNAYEPKFLYYILTSAVFEDFLTKLQAGSTISHLYQKDFISFSFDAPPSGEEQAAIVAVLSDMDAEIAVLEQRRDKTRALKQAMMQELLSGRTRLVTPAVEAHTRMVTQLSSAKPGAHEKHVPDAPWANVGRRPNVHFARTVLAAEIIEQLHDEPTLGHVKFEKLMFLVERLCKIDTGSTYHRDAAGPYDNRALRSIDSQLRKLKWFDARKAGSRYQYMPMKKRGGHTEYFQRYFHAARATVDHIVGTFRTVDTERCEIVATLFAAWEDLIRERRPVSDDAIVKEVLHNWHESKRRISRDRWRKALSWMKEKGFVPSGSKGAW